MAAMLVVMSRRAADRRQRALADGVAVSPHFSGPDTGASGLFRIRLPPGWPFVLLLVYALANGALYSALLPLWEGFDEPFHYSYVAWVSAGRGLPVLGTASVPEEVWQSLQLTPVSNAVAHNLPGLLTYDRHFALSAEQRKQRREQLERLGPAQARTGSPQLNYEAHQAPLAYAMAALPDRLLAERALLTRVLVLRLYGAWMAALLLTGAVVPLARHLRLSAPVRNAVLFCVFSSQMFWATVAHVGNDALAVPLACVFLALLTGAVRHGNRNVVASGLVLGICLLTKAYFVAWVPFAAAVWVWLWSSGRVAGRAVLSAATGSLLLAGSWYGATLLRTHTLAGMQEAVAGIGPLEAGQAARTMSWPAQIVTMAHASLWTGNNSFTSFSRGTLDALLLLIAGGWLAWALQREVRAEAALVAAAVFAFSMGIAYAAASSYAYTHGASTGASPWYMQVLLAPVLLLMFLGWSLLGKAGRWLAIVSDAIWVYFAVVSYLAKLVPWYAGRGTAHARPAELLLLYTKDGPAIWEGLRWTSLAGPTEVLTLLALTMLLLLMTAVAICLDLKKAGALSGPDRAPSG